MTLRFPDQAEDRLLRFAVIAARSPYPRLVLQSPHPSPLSAYRGFFGSRPFSQINAFLAQHGQKQIDWQP